MLDDGFQHRRLARDLDIVLLDALDPFGLGRLFPRGLLREPPRSLKRAGVVVLSRADLVAEADRLAIRAAAERQAGPFRWAEARHAPLDLVDAAVRSSPLGELDGRPDRRVLRDRQSGRVPPDPGIAWAAPWRVSGPSPTTTPIPPPTWPSWPRGRPPPGPIWS